MYVPKPICGWLVPSLSATVGALLSELMRGDDLDRPRAAPIIAVARREASRMVLQLGFGQPVAKQMRAVEISNCGALAAACG